MVQDKDAENGKSLENSTRSDDSDASSQGVNSSQSQLMAVPSQKSKRKLALYVLVVGMIVALACVIVGIVFAVLIGKNQSSTCRTQNTIVKV